MIVEAFLLIYILLPLPAWEEAVMDEWDRALAAYEARQ